MLDWRQHLLSSIKHENMNLKTFEMLFMKFIKNFR